MYIFVLLKLPICPTVTIWPKPGPFLSHFTQLSTRFLGPDDDDVYLKKDYNKGVTKYNPTQKCRPAKGISKRVSIQLIKDTE
jgi:hypothetical protein